MNIQAIADRLDTLNSMQSSHHYYLTSFGPTTTVRARVRERNKDYFVASFAVEPTAQQMTELASRLDRIQNDIRKANKRAGKATDNKLELLQMIELVNTTLRPVGGQYAIHFVSGAYMFYWSANDGPPVEPIVQYARAELMKAFLTGFLTTRK
jgi:hypothetical protein